MCMKLKMLNIRNYLKIIIIWIKVVTINCDSWDTFNVDINDILNENLMPGNLLLLEGPFQNNSDLSSEQRSLPTSTLDDDDGTFGTAFSTMGFHRKMINEYLCTNFIAGQIMNDQNNFISTKLERRVGSPDVGGASNGPSYDEIVMENRLNDNIGTVKENMLYDQGSSGYQNWLSKTTTLEDIYRHYSVKPNEINNLINATSPAGSRRNFDTRHDDGDDDDYEEGEITGYAVQQPSNRNKLKSFLFPTRPSLIGLKGGQFDSTADYSVPVTHHAIAGNKNGKNLRNLIFVCSIKLKNI